MKIPKSIKFGPHNVDVKKLKTILSSDGNGKKVEDGEKKRNPSQTESSDLGELDFDSLELKIKSGMPESLEAETFMHELMHMSLLKLQIPAGLEEKIVMTLSQDILSLIRDNKLDFLKE